MEAMRAAGARTAVRAVCALTLVVAAGSAVAATYTVTNGRNDGNRSLRWAIGRANADPGSTIAFAIPRSDSRYDNKRGVWRIRISRALPAITAAGTILDGTTQAANVGDDNPGWLGRGGTVGVDNLVLPGVAAPEIEILGIGGEDVGLDVAASNVVIRGIAIYSFGSASNSDSHADIRVRNVPGCIIEQCVLGTQANSFSDPGSSRSLGDHIRVVNGDGGIVRNNLIGYGHGNGIGLNGGANGWLIEGNEIRRNGIGNADLDAIHIEIDSGSTTVRGNLLVDSEACGIDSYGSSGSNRIENNEITGNGLGSGAGLETHGVRLYGTSNVVDRNVISSNVGPGVGVTSGSNANVITRNSIYANGAASGQIGIDLLAPSDNQSLGTPPYVTPNDPGDGDSGGNDLLNAPVLLRASLSGGQLILSGFARPGSAIELFVADADPSGFGEGRWYLVTLNEGSGADRDPGTGTYTSPVNGLTVGSDTTNRFRFILSAPPGVMAGTVLTATATAGSNTSEFSGNVVVNPGPAITLLKAVVPAGNSPPGAELTYSVTFTNGGDADAHNIVLVDPVPVETDFKLGSTFENLGTSGLAATVEYSSDGGGTWSYTPASGAGGAPAGFDRLVTHVRWVFAGILASVAPANQGNVGFVTRIQ